MQPRAPHRDSGKALPQPQPSILMKGRVMYHESRKKSPGRTHGATPQQGYGLPLPWYTVRGTSRLNKHYRAPQDGEWVLTYDTPDGTPLVAQYNSELDVLICARSGEYLMGIDSYLLLPSPDEVEMPSFCDLAGIVHKR